MNGNLEGDQENDEYDMDELDTEMDYKDDPIRDEISALYNKYWAEEYSSVLFDVEKLRKDYPSHPELIILHMRALDRTEQYESVISLYDEKKEVKGKRNWVIGKQPLPIILNVKALCRIGNEERAKEILQRVIKGEIDHFHNMEYIENLHLLNDEPISEMAFDLGLECAQEWIESNRSDATGVTDDGEEYYDEDEDDIIDEWFQVVEWLRNGGIKLRAYLEQAESVRGMEWFIDDIFRWESNLFETTAYSDEEKKDISDTWIGSLESE